jgi:hypothetical protein
MKNRNTMFTTILLALGCFVIAPVARALVPPPDGGYSGHNTAEGDGALNSLPPNVRGPHDNTALGYHTLFNLSTGVSNTAIGSEALLNNINGSRNTATGVEALFHNTVDGNTAYGYQALFNNTTGGPNTAIGDLALRSNTEGNGNTAVGSGALIGNTTGDGNTAVGVGTLQSNTTGDSNTAVGSGALASNTSAGQNTALGREALSRNTAGGNTAVGSAALHLNIDGSDNTATGFLALASNTTGNHNTALGNLALFANTEGSDNTAIGYDSLAVDNFGGNTAIGVKALEITSGDLNTAVGYLALVNNTVGDSNVAVGVGAGANVTAAGGVICIGSYGANVNLSCFIGNIRGVQTQNANAIPVLIDSNDQLGTQSSSRRFKRDIKPMDKASKAILALNPVTFHYKSDKTNTRQFGLVAEEVAAVSPDLVVRDANGDIYTVRYEAVNAMLLNEFLKEHRTVEELKKEIAALTATVKEQAAQIQRVSVQIKARKPFPQVVVNER